MGDLRERLLPGTATTYFEQGQKGFAKIEMLLLATGGLNLSQVCAVTGLEGSTIQNWVKRGWVANPRGKKYDEVHIARILIINALKECVKLEHISLLMSYVNGLNDGKSSAIIKESELFNYLCDALEMMGQADDLSRGGVESLVEAVIKHYQGPTPDARDKIGKALTVMVFACVCTDVKRRTEAMMSQILGELKIMKTVQFTDLAREGAMQESSSKADGAKENTTQESEAHEGEAQEGAAQKEENLQRETQQSAVLQSTVQQSTAPQSMASQSMASQGTVPQSAVPHSDALQRSAMQSSASPSAEQHALVNGQKPEETGHPNEIHAPSKQAAEAGAESEQNAKRHMKISQADIERMEQRRASLYLSGKKAANPQRSGAEQESAKQETGGGENQAAVTNDAPPQPASDEPVTPRKTISQALREWDRKPEEELPEDAEPATPSNEETATREVSSEPAYEDKTEKPATKPVYFGRG